MDLITLKWQPEGNEEEATLLYNLLIILFFSWEDTPLNRHCRMQGNLLRVIVPWGGWSVMPAPYAEPTTCMQQLG